MSDDSTTPDPRSGDPDSSPQDFHGFIRQWFGGDWAALENEDERFREAVAEWNRIQDARSRPTTDE